MKLTSARLGQNKVPSALCGARSAPIGAAVYRNVGRRGAGAGAPALCAAAARGAAPRATQTRDSHEQQLRHYKQQQQQQQQQQPSKEDPQWWGAPLLTQLRSGAAALVLAAIAVTGTGFNGGAVALAAGDAAPLYDSANVVARELRGTLTESLEHLERESGWKVRVYTAFGGPGLKDSVASPRELWGPPDARTLWLVVDPSSPNILNMVYIGDDVLLKLRRPFLQEVQARYGNLFYVRDEGESAAVQQAVGALTGCLAAPEGCKVVPGLPADQYSFTLAFAVAGGLIAGFVSRIPAQGIVKRQWVWLLIFSPLWASLFINFGLGPVVSRTSDLAPVLGNCAGFAAAAAITYLDKLLPAVAAQPNQDSD